MAYICMAQGTLKSLAEHRKSVTKQPAYTLITTTSI